MKKAKTILILVTCLITTIILLDFCLPGHKVENTIISIKTKRQSYNNAAGNSHVSFHIVTKNNTFNVTKKFANSTKENDTIYYTKSLIFNKINRYKNANKSISEIYSLRWFTGLVLPIIALILFGIHFLFNKRNEFGLIITLIVILGNIVFILIW